MSISPTALKQSLLAVVLTGIALSPVFGQATNSPIVFAAPEAITATFVDAPQVGSTEGGGGERAQWLKVEFHYSCAPLNAATFLDSAEFRIWIEGRDMLAPEVVSGAAPQGVAVALTATVTYVNIAASRDVYGVFYVNPATLVRYSTKQGATDFDRVFNIHVEAYVGGAKMDLIDKTKETDPNWYAQLHPLSGFVCRQDQCAFIVSDANRYPPIKLPATAQ